jgi:hypothetical protein
MGNNKNELTEEEYLKKHLSDLEKGSNVSKANSDNDNFDDVVESSRVNDLQYFNFDINLLPCGKFYPVGTLLMVRPAQVREIQAFSMVDENNFYDVVEKMNGMLQACVRVKYADGRVTSYLDIKDQDRLYVIFLIRELTFQQGNSLTIKTECPFDNTEVNIELIRNNFIFHPYDERLEKFFNRATNSYIFRIKNGKEFEVTPPNIGLQKSFTDYIIKENAEKKTPNLAFLKIIPFLLPNRNSITYDGIKAKLKEFENIDDVSFQFLNSAISRMTLGIKELKKRCSCGEEVTTDMQFPDGISGIFVIHDAFEEYIEE